MPPIGNSYNRSVGVVPNQINAFYTPINCSFALSVIPRMMRLGKSLELPAWVVKLFVWLVYETFHDTLDFKLYHWHRSFFEPSMVNLGRVSRRAVSKSPEKCRQNLLAFARTEIRKCVASKRVLLSVSSECAKPVQIAFLLSMIDFSKFNWHFFVSTKI